MTVTAIVSFRISRLTINLLESGQQLPAAEKSSRRFCEKEYVKMESEAARVPWEYAGPMQVLVSYRKDDSCIGSVLVDVSLQEMNAQRRKRMEM
jgi:hypothetical protein